MTTSTYKFGGVLNKCKNMQPTGDDKGTKTGMLVSVSGSAENDIMTWHMRNVTTIPGTSPSSFYHPWAYIGRVGTVNTEIILRLILRIWNLAS